MFVLKPRTPFWLKLNGSPQKTPTTHHPALSAGPQGSRFWLLWGLKKKSHPHHPTLSVGPQGFKYWLLWGRGKFLRTYVLFLRY